MTARTPHGLHTAKPLARAAAPAAATLLAACAVGPDYHRPTPPADTTYSTAPLPQTTAAAAVPGGEAQQLVSGRDLPFEWWEMFQSPQLSALIRRSLKNNPSIQAAQAALRQAREQVDAQRGYFYPTIDVGYQLQRQQLAGNLSGSNAPGVQGNGTAITAVQSTTPPYNEPLYYNLHTAQLTVGYVPDIFGTNRRQVEALTAQAQAQRFSLEATYITLASNVAAAAIQEACVRAQLAAVHELISVQERSLEILRGQQTAGYAMRIDVAAQEAALAQARALLPPLTRQLAVTRDLLHALAGEMPGEDMPETFQLDSLTLPHEIPLALPARLLEQRPDVRMAEEQMHAASAQVGVATAAMLPQLNISAAVGGTATVFQQMFSPGGPFWSIVGGVSQPLFHGGTLLHEKRAAVQALRAAAAQYQSAVITAAQNVADSLHAALADADELAASVEAEKAAKVALDLTQTQMQAGYVGYLSLLSAQSTYQQAVLTRVQAQAARYGDTVALFQALGGGWWNRTPPAQDPAS